MRKKPVALICSLAALALLTAGCQPKGAAGTPPTGGSGDTASSSAGGNGQGSSEATVQVPESLKHDAFRYIGFDHKKPLKYSYVKLQGTAPEEGSQTCVIKSADKDAADVLVERDGSLKELGTEEFQVKPDGIYLVSTQQGKPDKPVMQMPAKLPVGTVWDYKFPLTGKSGEKMTLTGKAKVEAVEKVKVEAGEFDTIRVTETATLDFNGKPSTVSMKTWYAKDVGIVKMKMEMKNEKGDIVTSTMELSGTGD